MTADSTDTWRLLEEQVESFFAANGYETRRNARLTGRSGATHEVDVLVRKSDGITEVSILVECKAWSHPIEKDVVAKAAMTSQDLGLSKAIVVSLQGWRVGAEQTARDLGVDLWDAADLERHLGQAQVARLVGGRAAGQRRVLGPEALLDADRAARQLAGQRSGMISKEELVWSRLAWVPFWVLDVRLSRLERRMFGRPQSKSRVVTNFYEALGGSYSPPSDPRIELVEIATDGVIPARVRDRQLASAIVKECDRLKELVGAQARERQVARLKSLGLTPPFDTVSVDAATEAAWPYYVGLLRRKDAERLVAINAVTRRPSDGMSRLLTGHLSHVVDALGRA
jgi:hypothetical protein